jgi:hypothetical protein
MRREAELGRARGLEVELEPAAKGCEAGMVVYIVKCRRCSWW